MQLQAPQFPPLFAARAVAIGEAPFDAAVAGAARGELEAGDACWSMHLDRAAAAFVLEPEAVLRIAAQMMPVMMVAIGDAIGAIGPPNLALTYRWPDRVLANGAQIGRVQLAVPSGCGPEDVPDYLVADFDLALTAGPADREPGHDLQTTFLHEEGCGDLDRTVLIEAVSRHFLSRIDGWQEDGFSDVHQAWLSRAHRVGDSMEAVVAGKPVEGAILGLDEEGGLLLRSEAGVRVIPLHETVIRGFADNV